MDNTTNAELSLLIDKVDVLGDDWMTLLMTGRTPTPAGTPPAPPGMAHPDLPFQNAVDRQAIEVHWEPNRWRFTIHRTSWKSGIYPIEWNDSERSYQKGGGSDGA